MDLDRRATSEHLSALNDAELIALFSSGKLSVQASEMARAEISQRDLPIPELVAPIKTDDLGEFLTLKTYLEPTSGHLLAACLKANGIPSLVADANTVQANMLLGLALGGVRVQVPTDLIPAARELLQRYERGDFALEADDLPE